jgi:hypothetical protein
VGLVVAVGLEAVMFLSSKFHAPPITWVKYCDMTLLPSSCENGDLMHQETSSGLLLVEIRQRGFYRSAVGTHSTEGYRHT